MNVSNYYKEAWEAGYLAGFRVSGEGWNGEYPFSDDGKDPSDDQHWLARRERAYAEYIEERFA